MGISSVFISQSMGGYQLIGIGSEASIAMGFRICIAMMFENEIHIWTGPFLQRHEQTKQILQMKVAMRVRHPIDKRSDLTSSPSIFHTFLNRKASLVKSRYHRTTASPAMPLSKCVNLIYDNSQCSDISPTSLPLCMAFHSPLLQLVLTVI